MKQQTRRGLLRGLCALSTVGFAGCSSLSNNAATPTPPHEYEHLRQTPTYRSDDIGLRLPKAVPRVESPNNADLIVLHGNPTISTEKVVTWLADERRVALLGDRAQQSWFRWTQSEPYRETFGDRGRSQTEPAPHLLVAAAMGTSVTTSPFSWADLPSNFELVQALEEALGEFATWTPA
jgi:hypothetical protein